MKNFNVLLLKEYKNTKIEILESQNLKGVTNPQMAMDMFFANQSGLKSRLIKITLNNSKIKTEAGALYFYKGKIKSDSSIGGTKGFLKKMVSGALTSESLVKPTYEGIGEVYLEPSFNHFYIMNLENEEIIVDKGLFYCCTDGIDVTPFNPTNISSAVLGGEGIFQIRLKGTGLVVLEVGVPQDEILEMKINKGEELKVDGNFAIIRTSGVDFSVTTSDKSLLNSALNKEGFLNTFRGEGSVWLAPTLKIYEQLGVNNTVNNIN